MSHFSGASSDWDSDDSSLDDGDPPLYSNIAAIFRDRYTRFHDKNSSNSRYGSISNSNFTEENSKITAPALPPKTASARMVNSINGNVFANTRKTSSANSSHDSYYTKATARHNPAPPLPRPRSIPSYLLQTTPLTTDEGLASIPREVAELQSDIDRKLVSCTKSPVTDIMRPVTSATSFGVNPVINFYKSVTDTRSAVNIDDRSAVTSKSCKTEISAVAVKLLPYEKTPACTVANTASVSNCSISKPNNTVSHLKMNNTSTVRSIKTSYSITPIARQISVPSTPPLGAPPPLSPRRSISIPSADNSLPSNRNAAVPSLSSHRALASVVVSSSTKHIAKKPPPLPPRNSLLAITTNSPIVDEVKATNGSTFRSVEHLPTSSSSTMTATVKVAVTDVNCHATSIAHSTSLSTRTTSTVASHSSIQRTLNSHYAVPNAISPSLIHKPSDPSVVYRSKNEPRSSLEHFPRASLPNPLLDEMFERNISSLLLDCKNNKLDNSTNGSNSRKDSIFRYSSNSSYDINSRNVNNSNLVSAPEPQPSSLVAPSSLLGTRSSSGCVDASNEEKESSGWQAMHLAMKSLASSPYH